MNVKNEEPSGIVPLGEIDWKKYGGDGNPWDKVDDEYESWFAKLKNSRLAAKVDELWRLWKNGCLSRADMMLVASALVYCLAPIDAVPDIIPLAGFADDLIVVMSVLAYLRQKTDKAPIDETVNDGNSAVK